MHVQSVTKVIKANSTVIFTLIITLVYLFIAISHWNHPGYYSAIGSDSELQRVMQQAAHWYHQGDFYKTLGVSGYVHYLDTPTWIVYFLSKFFHYTALDYTFPFRLIPIGITAIALSTVCLAFPKYRYSWLAMLGLIFMIFQKGFYGYSGSLEHVGYSLAIGIMSVPLGYKMIQMSKNGQLILAMIYGMTITAFAYDFVPVSGLTLIASFLLANVFYKQTGNSLKTATIILGGFLAGLLLTLTAHYLHTGIALGDLGGYLKDLIASGLSRVSIQTPFKTDYYSSLRDILPADYSYWKTIFTPYLYFGAYAFIAEFPFFNFSFDTLFALLILLAFLSPFVLQVNQQQKKTMVFSLTVAFLGTILWDILAPYHAVFHYHLLPRHLYILYVYLLYFSAEILAHGDFLSVVKRLKNWVWVNKTKIMDASTACFLLAIVLLVFATNCSKIGFYSDDSSWLALTHFHWNKLLSKFMDYVAGRNLMVVWQYLLFNLSHAQSDSLLKIHFLQSTLDGINVVLLYFLLRKFLNSRFAALWGTLFFAFYTNHGETHYWLTAISQNLLSTTFVLAYMLIALENIHWASAGSNQVYKKNLLFFEWFFFVCAIFTYEQGLFVLLAAFLFRVAASNPYQRQRFYLIYCLLYIVPSLVCVFLKIIPGISITSGPVLSAGSFLRLGANVVVSYNNSINSVWEILLHYRPYMRLLSHGQKSLALVSTMLACLVSLFLILVSRNQINSSVDGSKLSTLGKVLTKQVLICLAGIVFCLLAYLPSYFWYISPRHNYLPTVGLCIIIAAVVGIIERIIAAFKKPGALIATQLIITALFSIALYHMIIYDLWEKQPWIESYQLRKNFYTQCNQQILSGKESAILLEGFPDLYGGVPFFAHETPRSIGNKFCRLDYLVQNGTKTNNGYIVRKEVDRWGNVALHYLPDDKIFVSRCLKVSPNSLSVSFKKDVPVQSHLFQLGIASPADAENIQLDSHMLVNKPFALGKKSKQTQQILLTGLRIPPNLKRDELLGILLTSGSAHNPQEDPFCEIPIDTSWKCFVVIPLENQLLKQYIANSHRILKITLFPQQSSNVDANTNFEATKIWVYLLDEQDAKQLQVINITNVAK